MIFQQIIQTIQLICGVCTADPVWVTWVLRGVGVDQVQMKSRCPDAVQQLRGTRLDH